MSAASLSVDPARSVTALKIRAVALSLAQVGLLVILAG
jgi:hypothetical protein